MAATVSPFSSWTWEITELDAVEARVVSLSKPRTEVGDGLIELVSPLLETFASISSPRFTPPTLAGTPSKRLAVSIILPSSKGKPSPSTTNISNASLKFLIGLLLLTLCASKMFENESSPSHSITETSAVMSPLSSIIPSCGPCSSFSPSERFFKWECISRLPSRLSPSPGEASALTLVIFSNGYGCDSSIVVALSEPLPPTTPPNTLREWLLYELGNNGDSKTEVGHDSEGRMEGIHDVSSCASWDLPSVAQFARPRLGVPMIGEYNLPLKMLALLSLEFPSASRSWGQRSSKESSSSACSMGSNWWECRRCCEDSLRDCVGSPVSVSDFGEVRKMSKLLHGDGVGLWLACGL
mmetsp:Transcript_8926/g.20046  ORF Transcript_8926/g.20046 Transcript_8926/m.20046 type:complete len:354 (-) Transcript_8926:607-1668(-)